MIVISQIISLIKLNKQYSRASIPYNAKYSLLQIKLSLLQSLIYCPDILCMHVWQRTVDFQLTNSTQKLKSLLL